MEVSRARASSHYQRVALVAGVTGVVGASLAELLTKADAPTDMWKVYGVARRIRPKWFDDYAVEYIQCDLLDRQETRRKIAALTDVTHLFFVAWASRDTEEENCSANGSMLQNIIDALLPNAKELRHVCLQTGIKHYLGSHFQFKGSVTHQLTYREDLPRLKETNFYYVQEDILFETVRQTNGRLTWSVHRPGLIFGFSPNSFVNTALALAVYASICKYEGLPLVFTGTQTIWESHLEACDAHLVAEQEIWAATSSRGKNGAFNISNGDDISWKKLWPAIARYFDIAAAYNDGQPQSLVEKMQCKGQLWDEIVAAHSLYPTKLLDFMNGWWVVDIVFSRLPQGRSSMEKSKRHGFLGSRNTEVSLLSSFNRMREIKLIP